MGGVNAQDVRDDQADVDPDVQNEDAEHAVEERGEADHPSKRDAAWREAREHRASEDVERRAWNDADGSGVEARGKRDEVRVDPPKDERARAGDRSARRDGRAIVKRRHDEDERERSEDRRVEGIAEDRRDDGDGHA